MFKNFLMRKMLEKQTKGMPKEEQEKLLAMLEKDPDLFMQIATEIQAEMKKGKDQMAAAMAIMPKYQSKLQALMADVKK